MCCERLRETALVFKMKLHCFAHFFDKRNLAFLENEIFDHLSCCDANMQIVTVIFVCTMKMNSSQTF